MTSLTSHSCPRIGRFALVGKVRRGTTVSPADERAIPYRKLWVYTSRSLLLVPVAQASIDSSGALHEIAAAGSVHVPRSFHDMVLFNASVMRPAYSSSVGLNGSLAFRPPSVPLAGT